MDAPASKSWHSCVARALAADGNPGASASHDAKSAVQKTCPPNETSTRSCPVRIHVSTTEATTETTTETQNTSAGLIQGGVNKTISELGAMDWSGVR